MDHALFQLISRRYGLGDISDVQPVRPGTVSRVWRLTTARGEFLARTLPGPGHGAREWAIFRHLRARGFARTPAILPTADGAPAAEADGTWYQLQRYCPGVRPDPARPGVPEAMARLGLELTHALSDCPAVDAPADPFDLAAVWGQYRRNRPRLSLPLSQEEADRAAARCCALPEEGRQVIHGDLGPWNLIAAPEGGLLVIDFGQARMGDPYFDLASLLAGAVNHAPPALRRQVAEAVLARYRAALPLDLPRLRGQLTLWAWRGLAQCLCSPAAWRQMAGRFYSVLAWAEGLGSAPPGAAGRQDLGRGPLRSRKIGEE